MPLSRGRLDLGGNDVRAQGPGDSFLDQSIITPVTTVGNATLTAAQLVSGIIRRTGPTAGYADIFPSADSLLTAVPQLGVGDSFKLNFINTVAFANTPTGAEGVVLGNNTGVALSAARQYLISILGDGVRQAFNAATTNASNVVTGLDAIAIANIRPGQGVTGTGIPANAFVTSVNQTARSFTISANATATGIPAVTSFPRYQVDGLFSATL